MPKFAQKSTLSIILIILALVLLAVNMRSPIVMIGSLVSIFGQELGLSALHIGYLGALPMPLFALGALFAPKIAQRFGLERMIVLMIVGLTLAVAGRVWFSVVGLFVGTFVLSLAIGMLNVLIAPFIKKYAPNHIALTTGIFSLSMSVCAGFSAYVVLPLASALSWQWALSGWAIFGVLAVLAWAYMATFSQTNSHSSSTQTLTKFSVWRCVDAYVMAVFFGIQSLLFYSVASFLPSVGVGYGMSQTQATQLALVFQVMAPVAVFALTFLMKRQVSVKWVAVCSAVLNLVGSAGLLWLPDWLHWWSALLGLGGASIFTLTLMMFSLRTTCVENARDLSGMVQAVGYAIALLGPLVLGFLFQKTGTWQLPLQVLFGLMALNLGVSFFAGNEGKVDNTV